MGFGHLLLLFSRFSLVSYVLADDSNFMIDVISTVVESKSIFHISGVVANFNINSNNNNNKKKKKKKKKK